MVKPERREGTGESKVGLAGEVAMGDGVRREEGQARHQHMRKVEAVVNS